MTAHAPILELHNVKKIFHGKPVLDNIDITVKEGEILGIVGPSGCGKSTLFKILLGYYAPTKGEVLLNGTNIMKNLDRLRNTIGYTTQDDSFYAKLTVGENMRYYAHLYNVKLSGKKLTIHIDTILDQVKLSYAKNRKVEPISGGMRRRLNFAISLLHNPSILVLDEPTTGLDPILVGQFWDVVEKVAKTGKTIIFPSHIFPEIEEHCDRVAVMNKGKIQEIIEVKNLGKKSIYELFEEVLER